MIIGKGPLDRSMEGRAAGDLFGKKGILAELTKALAEHAVTTGMAEHPGEGRAEWPSAGQSCRPILATAVAAPR